MKLKPIVKDKRGVAGLDTAKAFMLLLFVVAIIGFIMIIAITELNDVGVAKTSGNVNVVNESGYINSTGYVFDGASAPDVSFDQTSLVVRNASSGQVVESGNYTVASGTTLVNATAVTYPNVNIDYSYTYNQFASVEGNVSDGVTNFFGDATTWLALLSVVVIILIISIVIFAVNRFGGNETSQRGEGLSGTI